MIAAAGVDADRLKKPLVVVATADEEVGGGGAHQVATESRIMGAVRPTYGVVAEPTSLTPVYAHKGAGHIVVTAHGRAAHTSTGLGESANFKIAPFLAEMAEMAERIKADERYQNAEFNPPSNGFNMVITDYDTKQNVSAARSTCHICFRTMPDDHSEELVDELVSAGRKLRLRGYEQHIPSLLRRSFEPHRAAGLRRHRRQAAGDRALRDRRPPFQGAAGDGGPGSRQYRTGSHGR